MKIDHLLTDGGDTPVKDLRVDPLVVRSREENKMSGAELIAEERKRQVEKEGFRNWHDDEHDEGQMAEAAVCYIMGERKINGQWLWSWSDDDWKPKSKLQNLIRAGALIAAEIDRLQRSAQVDPLVMCRLQRIGSALDAAMGDTDPDFPEEMVDEEIRAEDPLFWATREVHRLLKDMRT